jgi:hypothetical protein
MSTPLPNEDVPVSTDPTCGPWRWEVNPKSHVIKLCGGKPMYDMTVMDFVRWGMSRAQPRFVVGGILYKGEQFKYVAPNRDHHKEWFQLLSHPDANLIAAAPDLLAALQGLQKKFWEVAARHNDRSCDYDVCPEVRATVAAIKKATLSALKDPA